MGFELPSELQGVHDEYDSANNAELLRDYRQLFEVLQQIHELHPQWRFGQLLDNLAVLAGKTQPGILYHIPDERLLKVAREYLARQRAAHATTP